MALSIHPIDPLDFPEYDLETLRRKIHAVCGYYKPGEINLTAEQFLKVMELCKREYIFRKIPIISSRALRLVERHSHLSYLRAKYQSLTNFR